MKIFSIIRIYQKLFQIDNIVDLDVSTRNNFNLNEIIMNKSFSGYKKWNLFLVHNYFFNKRSIYLVNNVLETQMFPL